MSQMRDTATTTDPLKFWKIFILPEKSGDLIAYFMKAVVFISLVVSLIFFLFSTFSSTWCRSCITNISTIHHLRTSSSLAAEEKTNISHILFGIGGSIKSWKDRRHYSELWWEPNVTRGFVWLDEKPSANETWPETSPPYKISEDTSKFNYTCWYGSRSALRIARIVLESYRLGLDNVRWYVMGDDDTVYFKENLVEVLSRYDHNQMYYIGGNSESVEQDMIHSYGMAYGGGGIALSSALVEQLVKLLDGCIDRYPELYGSDERIRACVTEIGVPLTRELGFHQVDVRGDAYGLLAAHPLAPLVSLHHLDAVKPLFPAENQIESLRLLMSVYKIDPGRTLQRSFCYDLDRNWSISVSWGYTVEIYPSILTAKQLETPFQTFLSWRTWNKDGPFTFNTRPMRQEACLQPVIFYLDRVDEIGLSETRTSYKRVFREDIDECGLDTYTPILSLQAVNVSSSKMEQNEWTKALRRQCCEIVYSSDSAVLLRMRKCGIGESGKGKVAVTQAPKLNSKLY